MARELPAHQVQPLQEHPNRQHGGSDMPAEAKARRRRGGGSLARAFALAGLAQEVGCERRTHLRLLPRPAPRGIPSRATGTGGSAEGVASAGAVGGTVVGAVVMTVGVIAVVGRGQSYGRGHVALTGPMPAPVHSPR
ncbi:hypothetical protein ACTMU2_33075 [Cupriavidus basilensis]